MSAEKAAEESKKQVAEYLTTGLVDRVDKEIKRIQPDLNKKISQLVDLAERAEKVLPKLEGLERDGNPDIRAEAAKLAKEISEAKDPSLYTARDWFVQAFNADDLEQKLSYYTKVTELSPDNTQAYFNRGIAKHALKRYGDAIADYTTALELKPDYAAASQNMAEIQIITDSYDAAIKTLSNDSLDLSLPKDRATCAWLRCVATAAMGDPAEETEVEFREAMQADFTHTFGTELIEQWVVTAKLPDKTKDYIRSVTKQFKAKLERKK